MGGSGRAAPGRAGGEAPPLRKFAADGPERDAHPYPERVTGAPGLVHSRLRR
jgi:hypothetical protein